MTENPARWLPDPTGERTLRYWDGTAWTDHTSDEANPASPSPTGRPLYKRKGVLIAAGVTTLLALGVLAGGGEQPPDAERVAASSVGTSERLPLATTTVVPTTTPTTATPTIPPTTTTAKPAPTTTAAAPPPTVQQFAAVPTTARPAPATTAAPPPTAPPTTEVRYQNCDEVEAAGKAPLREGEPGYRKGLDRDGDGIACDQKSGEH